MIFHLTFLHVVKYLEFPCQNTKRCLTAHIHYIDDECQLYTQWLNQTDDHVERDYCIRKITQDMPTYFVETFDQQKK